MRKGKFITIYGINNIGKTTHAKRLVRRLRREGFDAVYIKYPIYELEPTGPKLNRILRSYEPQSVTEEELQTIFMQNRKDYEPELKKMLDEGKIIVAEDYIGTGIAWGTAKGLTQEWMEELNEDLLKEDFSIIIVGKRIDIAKEKKHIHESNDELINRVAKVFDLLGEKYGWHKVVLQEEQDETAALIWEEIKYFLKI